MVDFTVAICTYNGANRLPAVLERLRSQTPNLAFSWEVLVVDNNSTDQTKQVILDYQARWPQAQTFRYVFEGEQGPAFARLAAIKAANGTLVGFLDDDTLPAADWVTSACRFGVAHPRAGVYGSQIHGDFEVEPPANFRKIAAFLAIVERGSKEFIYERKSRMLPPAAGMVVRRQAWLACVPSRPFLKGRTTQAMLASEDLEVISHIQNAGWEVWYNPRMHIYHQIPHWRLERDYLISLVRGIGLARHHIRMLRTTPWHRPFAFPLFLINDLRKAVYHWLKYRKAFKTDVTVACEMEFLSSSLISPFYLWQKNFTDTKMDAATPQ